MLKALKAAVGNFCKQIFVYIFVNCHYVLTVDYEIDNLWKNQALLAPRSGPIAICRNTPPGSDWLFLTGSGVFLQMAIGPLG